LLALALPARNLAIAEAKNLDVAVPCAACFNRLKSAQQAVKKSAATKEKVNKAIEMDYQGSNEVKALLDVMTSAVNADMVKEKVVRPLDGFLLRLFTS